MKFVNAEGFSPKKHLPILVAAIFVLGLVYLVASGSTGGSAGDVIEKQAAVMESYVEGIESAKSADDMVKVIERYTADMKDLIPRIEKFQESYAETNDEDLAERMEAEMARVEEASRRLPAAMMKAAGYMMDVKVQDAMSKMAEELGDFQQ